MRTVPPEELQGPGGYQQRSLGQLLALAAERGDVFYFVNVAPSTEVELPSNQVVRLVVKVVPPGGILHPPRYKC